MVVAKWLFAVIATCYVGFSVVLYTMQRAMMYPVPQTVPTSPAAAGYPEAQDQILTTSDGEKLIAWYVPPRGGKPVVIFLHGNGDILAWRVDRFRQLTADGTGLLAVSFRGYAGSSGSPTEDGLIRDAEAGYAFVRERHAPERIAVWGYSLGTGPAVALAARHPVSALVLEAPYSSTVDVAASMFWFLPVRWLLKDQFHSDRLIGGVTAPLLVLHGERDQVIPFRFGEKLYGFATGAKQFIRYPDGDHINLDSFGATKAVRDFVNR